MSDGPIKFFNRNPKQLGMERVERICAESTDSSGSDIRSQVTKLVDQWSGTKSQEDNTAVLVMKAKK